MPRYAEQTLKDALNVVEMACAFDLIRPLEL
jgi:hypothetical protein